MSNKISAFQILRNKFPEEEYAILKEVPDDVSSRNRYLDFMIINFWQSRGLAITGVERKSFRGDWLKEVKNPQKQETHFKYCDYFYLLTDNEDVAKLEEIPETWGWWHTTTKGTLKCMKAAPKLSPLPIPRSMLCAMIRRASSKEGMIYSDSINDMILSAKEKGANEAISNRDYKLKRAEELEKIFEEFKTESGGVDLGYHWHQIKPANFAKIVKMIQDNEVEKIKKQLTDLKRSAEFISERINKAFQTVELEIAIDKTTIK